MKPCTGPCVYDGEVNACGRCGQVPDEIRAKLLWPSVGLAELEFKAEDFADWPFSGERCTVLAQHANQLLRKRLEKAAPLWYGPASSRAPDGTLEVPVVWTTGARPGFDTHTARLVCIERVEADEA